MEIRNRSLLADACRGIPVEIDSDSPELLFMQHLCAGDADAAAALFGDEKQFGGASVADVPFGRYEEKAGIRALAAQWLSRFHASAASVEPIFQTRAGGRSATELNVNFVVDGMINQVPMFVIGDLRAHGMLDEVRIYCHCTQVPGLTPYRKPMFRSAHLEMGDPGLLTGAVKEYYCALHRVDGVDVDRILRCMSPDCAFGGYEALGTKGHGSDPETLRKVYEHMATYIPMWVGMRYETLIDDGVNCVIEWVHIVSDRGVEEGARVCLSGVASYTRNADGLLCSIRICDYAGYERSIDWSKTPISKEEAYAINRVHAFPVGVGRNPN